MKPSNKFITAAAFLAVMLMSATTLPSTPGKTRTSRIRFARGRTTVVRKGGITQGGDVLYLVRAKAGQTMIAHVTSPRGNAVFDVTEPPPGSGAPSVREQKDWTDKLDKCI